MKFEHSIVTKIDYISKTKSRTKKNIDGKSHYQINPDLSCKIGTYEVNLNFCASFWTVWTLITQERDMILSTH